ncbi:hypothetical protein E15042_p1-58 (plasmid) [Escherichia coli]|nr:hypothetical protein EC51104_p1-43 [Escherichia coli]BCZ70369.1 hypothetical protein EC12E115_p1-056 [Escherichia coli O145:H28]BCS79781.1 hypothetical protein E15042_p1-58 [Escherichia coli]BCZ75706.1 hypothetical protein EC16003_p1-059 [Escherichia coli O145:H28]BDR01120.1 hypothetical protein JNE072929_p1-43 [Escherichia coli]
MVSLNRRPEAAITSVVFVRVVFQQDAGLINHRLTAGNAFRDGEAVITGGPFTLPQCLFSGLNQGRQQFSRDGHLAVFAHVADNLHRRGGRNTGLSPLVFRDVLQARQDGPDFMIGQGNIHSVSEGLNLFRGPDNQHQRRVSRILCCQRPAERFACSVHTLSPQSLKQ